MTWTYEVDVVAALLLEIEHHCRYVLRCDRLTDALLADFPVLAKDATEIAPAEEDRSRASPTAQRILLSVVGSEAVNDGMLACPADRSFGRN